MMHHARNNIFFYCTYYVTCDTISKFNEDHNRELFGCYMNPDYHYAMAALDEFHYHGDKCAEFVSNAQGFANNVKEYACKRKELKGIAKRAQGGIDSISDFISKNQKMIDKIPYIGTTVKALNKAAGNASDKLLGILSSDIDLIWGSNPDYTLCESAEEVANKLGKFQGFVQDSADTADRVHTMLDGYKTFAQENSCCIKPQINGIVNELELNFLHIGTSNFKNCYLDMPDLPQVQRYPRNFPGEHPLDAVPNEKQCYLGNFSLVAFSSDRFECLEEYS